MLSLNGYDEEAIFKLIENLRKQEEQRQMVLQKLLQNLRKTSSVRVNRVLPEKLRVGGTDGGMAQFSLRAMDVILLKSIGSVFSYSGKRLLETTYFPSEIPALNMLCVHEPIDRLKLDVLAGMERQKNEIQTARGLVKNNEVDLMLLDGSVIPQYAGGYRDVLLEREYRQLVEEYTALYKTCVERGVFLAGFVKDTRGKRFLGKLLSSIELEENGKKILENSRDALILNSVINAHERTECLSYVDDNKILADFGEWKSRIYLFYMKSSPADLPFRIEFVEFGGDEELTASCLASWLSFLLSFSDELSTPSVLLEADLRARLREEEVSGIKNQLIAFVKNEFGVLRREQKFS